MKKGMVVFALLLMVCAIAFGALGEGALKRFEDTWMLAKELELGEDAAWVLDREGTLWIWPYDDTQPQILCRLPALPGALENGELSYDRLTPEDRALADESVQFLIGSGGALYAVNQFAGRIGTVDGQGVHWQDTRFDTSPLLDDMGLQRMKTGEVIQGGILYILTNYWEESPAAEYFYKVIEIDLATGKTEAVNVPNAHIMCLYQGDLLLLCSDEGGNWLERMDIATGQRQALDIRTPPGEAGGLAYHQPSGTLWLTVGSVVYQSSGGGNFAMVYNNPFPYTHDAMLGRALHGGRYALTGEGIIVMPPADFSGERQVLTVCLDGVSDMAVQQAFLSAHPGVLLDERVQRLPAADVAERIRSGDTETDVFGVRVDSAFGELIAKGYAATLHENAAIAQSVAAMYPEIRKVLLDDNGQIVAYPQSLDLSLWDVRLPLWEKYFGQEPLPATWQELFSAMLRFEKDSDGGDLFLLEWSYEHMLSQVLSSFLAQRDGTAINFLEPAFQETLALLAQVNEAMLGKGISYLFEGDVYPESELLGEHSLFLQGGSGFSTHKATLNSYGGLPPFTFDGMEPVIPGYMRVLVVNPLSPRQELARDYVALAAKKDTNLIRYYMLHENATEPVEDPAPRGAAKWIIPQEGIDAWRDTVPHLRFFERSAFLREDMQKQFDKLCARYLGGQLTLDALLKQMNDVARMVSLEQR